MSIGFNIQEKFTIYIRTMLRYIFLILFVILSNGAGYSKIHQSLNDFRVESPDFVLGEDFAEIKIFALANDRIDTSVTGNYYFKINGENKVISFNRGKALYTLQLTKTTIFEFEANSSKKNKFKIKYLEAWLSIIPPLMAILLSLIFKEVVLSLFLSIFFGAYILTGFDVSGILKALLRVLDNYLLNALYDKEHLSLLIFSLFISGMVALVSKNGGLLGLVKFLEKKAHSPRSAQFMTYVMSIAIFYDNYANTLIVGNTMRHITDKYRISREKLAFIVHCTSGSIVSVALITTWVGAQLTYISDAAANMNMGESPFAILVKSLQFAYYPAFMLFFILVLIFSRMDFNQMANAEVAARSSGVKNEMESGKIPENFELIKIPESEGNHAAWINVLIPVLSVLFAAFAGLIISGAENVYEILSEKNLYNGSYSFMAIWDRVTLLDKEDVNFFDKLGALLSNADFYLALLWASFFGLTVAIVLTIFKRGISLSRTISAMVQGFMMMVSPIIILIFAWAFADMLQDLHTAEFLTSLFTRSINPLFIPVLVFLISALFSFTSGSVWGTMAILYPLLLPITWILCLKEGLNSDDALVVIYNVTAMILTGSVFGIHCSPVSDTTILSSISSKSNPIAHIRTQIPYAATVALVSLCVSLFTVTGFHWSVYFLVGFASIILIVKILGKRVE